MFSLFSRTETISDRGSVRAKAKLSVNGDGNDNSSSGHVVVFVLFLPLKLFNSTRCEVNQPQILLIADCCPNLRPVWGARDTWTASPTEMSLPVSASAGAAEVGSASSTSCKPPPGLSYPPGLSPTCHWDRRPWLSVTPLFDWGSFTRRDSTIQVVSPALLLQRHLSYHFLSEVVQKPVWL